MTNAATATTPAAEQQPAIDLAFRQAAQAAGDRVALHFLGERLTYRELDALVERLAGALHQWGVEPGARAILYMPHCPQWIITWLALQRLGAVAVPVTHFYGPEQLTYIARDSGAETIFCMDTGFGYVDRIREEAGLTRVVVATLGDFLPWWKRLVGRIYDKIPTGDFQRGAGVATFKALLRRGASLPGPVTGGIGPDGQPVAGGDEALTVLLYTGGTTGMPKGVPLTHKLLLLSVKYQRDQSEPLIPRGQDVAIQGAPLYHILGLAIGLGALLSGDTLVLLPRMNLDAIFEHIERYRARTFFGTPTMYRMILEHDRLDLYDLSSLEYAMSGGDVLPREVAQRWHQRFGRPIYPGYGATETCGGIALTLAAAPSPEGSTGKVLPYWQVRVVDPETLAPAPDGEAGELLVSSDYMIRGYWNKPDETARHFVTLDGRLWYRTGDMVRIDDGGWLYFVDRSVDLIKHKGYRVAAAKVETVLQEHPAVIAACVVGVPDPSAGERVKAFVVVKEDVRGVSAYDLIRWCRDRLASYEVPQYIEFRDMLPKSKVGKLLRRELRDEERRKLNVGR